MLPPNCMGGYFYQACDCNFIVVAAVLLNNINNNKKNGVIKRKTTL